MVDTVVTVQTVIDNSIARAKDANKNQWADSQMLILLNKAVDYVHKLLIREQSEVVITDETISLVAGTQEYDFSGNLDDFWGMAKNGVYFSSVVKPLDPVAYEDKIREGTTTTDAAPESYYLTGTALGVLSIPTATSVATYPTLNCRYFKGNATLALTSTMPYKNILNEPIAMFMDNVALIKTETPVEEITNLYNALEESTLAVINARLPI